MKKAIFYHAGCPVCKSVESDILNLITENLVEVVHLGTHKTQINKAEQAGVKSVPAMVLSNGNVLHINFGATIEDLK